MDVQSADQMMLFITDQKLIDAIGLHDFNCFDGELVRANGTWRCAHYISNPQAGEILLIFNQTSQIAIGKDTDDALIVIDNGSHRHAFLCNFQQGSGEFGVRGNLRDGLAGAHHISYVGEQAASEAASRVGAGEVFGLEAAGVEEHDGQRIPHIVFTKGGGLWLEEMAELRPDVLGLDWTVNLKSARARVGDRVALQGNLDPNVLFAQPEQIRAEVTKTLESFGAPGAPRNGHVDSHIFNLGHGISQYTPPENVTALVDAVHEVSRRLRQPG